jgi:hypothetical protein
MTAATEVVTLFGDAEQGVWGVGIGDDQPRWSLAGFDGAVVAPKGPLTVSESSTPNLNDAGEQAASTPEALELLMFCRVTGVVTVDGKDVTVDLPGMRCAALSTGKLGSLRLFGSWLEGGRELALAAVRPKGAGGQDRDDLEVLTVGDRHSVVFDPRLSTTYDQIGAPLRVGVELWLGDSDDGDQFPRRFNGEATGATLAVDGGGLPLKAFALRCRSRGQSGTGVYGLLQRS